MKKMLSLVILLLIFIIPNSVNAVGICPANTLSKYQTQALTTKVNYEETKN